MAWIYAVMLLLSLFLIPSSHGGIQEQVVEKVLPNGLKVILLENHKIPIVTLQVWYRVGSRNESWGKTGISHMLEHMMFKSTKKVGPGEFSRIIQANGGNNNAMTSYDYTTYFSTLNSDRINIALELEADRMRELVFKEDDFRTERLVVMEERRLRTMDNPHALVEEQVMATAFQVQPYHWPTVGWMEDIEAITLDDLKAYYRQYYSPSNAFLVVTGDFRSDLLLARIEKTFGSIPRRDVPDPRNSTKEIQEGERRVTVRKEARLPYLAVAYHVPNLGSPDGYVLEVISKILAGGKSSRLYEKLVREKGLALYASAANYLLSHDPNVFLFSVTPLAKKDLAKVEEALDEEIGRLKKELVSSEELTKAKNQAEAGLVYGQDSCFSQAMMLGQNEIARDWRKIDEYIPSIQKVTAQDILRVARLYFVPENRTVGVLAPVISKSEQAERPPLPRSAQTVR
ncbi:MAG TPA: pitrilysin family protein [Syntrophorhabdaceae bacterium]|jgi:zinc protease